MIEIRPIPGLPNASHTTRRIRPMDHSKYASMLAVAMDEARQGFNEGGIPIGAALFTQSGELLSPGRNRRVQQGDPTVHGETHAFCRAGRQRSSRTLVTLTHSPPA